MARPRSTSASKGPTILDPRFTDVANAKRFMSAHGEDLRYCPEWGQWLAWSGKKWTLCADDSAAVTRSILTMMDTRKSALAKGDVGLANWATMSQAVARVHAAISLASKSPSMSVEYTALDSDPWILNVQNGTMDLRACMSQTWRFGEGFCEGHDRSKLCTKITRAHYDPHAICPKWIKFLMMAMNGDASMVEMLQRIVGYCLTGSVREQALFFFHGDGHNGKSTFFSTVQKLLGDYAVTAPRGFLESDRSNDHDTRLAMLYRARLVLGSEVEKGKHLAESMVKDLTGGERIAARRMREDYWHFDPTHKIVIPGNHKPHIVGTDLGIWRRIKLVPWTVTIPEKKKDRELASKLEAELPGILNWALVGCHLWLTDDLGLRTDLVERATSAYRNEQFDMQRLPDLFKEFCGASLDLGVGLRVPKKDVWTRYVEWSKENNHPIGDDVQRRVSDQLFLYLREDMELGEARTGEARYWTGAKLKTRSEN